MTKHVLLYTDDPGVGGVAQYNHSILLGLKARGYRVTCVQGRAATPLIKQQIQQGIQHEWLEFDTLKNFDRTFYNLDDASAIFAHTQPDLILFSDGCPISNFAAKHVARQLGIPYLVVIGFVAPYLADQFAFCLDEVAEHYVQAKIVIAVSQENLNLLHQRFRLPPQRGEVIYCGRPDAYFAPLQQSVRDRLRATVGVPDDGILCFTAARLEGIKGYAYQLETIAQLRHTPIWSKLYFVWAGDGSLQTQLATALQELGVTDQVKLLGHRWDVVDWYDAADIFVFPSEMEGLPLVVIEAMAKGVPVIASAVSGIPEALGDTGKLLPNPAIAPQKTVRELVATLSTWAVDLEQCRRLGRACNQRAQTLFREERMVRETMMVIERSLLPDGDYVSPGLAIARPDDAFPHMTVGNPQTCPWLYLRREIPHTWYVDARQPIVGFLNRDEAQILYNTALQFQGKRALEIGCWMGWSACHLALAGVVLDVIDPLLATAEVYHSVRTSLQAAGVLDRVNLRPGYSPQAVNQLAAQQQRQWSLIFIDGNHDAPGPLEDAIACESLAESDAMILFHDLASPDVAQGLDYLKQRGWNTVIYQTMQIMGVAWRGNVTPVAHQPDPRIHWTLPAHLQHYGVSGLTTPIPQTIANRTMDHGILTRLLDTVAQLPAPTPQPLANTLDRQQLVTWLRQGQAAYNSGNCEQAIAAFTQVLTLNPGSAIAHYHLSTLHGQQGNLHQSVSHQTLASNLCLTDQPTDEEFQALAAAIAPYTLLSQERLFSLYTLAKQICLDDIPGNVVECGTCKGGSAALLAAVVQRYSLRPRLVYAFDTFSGMPEPTDVDRHAGIPANETPWGVGTLKAPVAENLNVICAALGVSDIVVPVAGLFAQTLPQTREAIADIALLHADGDWYESTMDIFTTLYDNVVPAGCIQVDDYGHWEGCRKAVHDFERQRYESFALRCIDFTGVWFRKHEPMPPEYDYWRSLWHLAHLAETLGDRTLAVQAAQAVLRIVPGLIAVEDMLARLQSPVAMTEGAASVPLATTLSLRAINLIVFPDWTQPDEMVFTDLTNLLRVVLPHWDRDRITLLIDMTSADPEHADMLLADGMMHLLTEENIEISDEGPEIVPVHSQTISEWQSLLSHLSARVVMEHENKEAIATTGIAAVPTYTLEDVAQLAWS